MKKIRDFENYMISENCMLYKDGKEIKLSLDKDGYLCCALVNENGRKNDENS